MFRNHRYHSEKLALVYGLINTPAGNRLILGNETIFVCVKIVTNSLLFLLKHSRDTLLLEMQIVFITLIHQVNVIVITIGNKYNSFIEKFRSYNQKKRGERI